MSRIGVWGLVFLVLALLVSGFQLLSYRSALRNSAQFIGSFPSNMPAITDLVKGTSYRLIVVDDFCAYGQFSNPSGHEAYKKALLDAAKRGVRVELHVYDPATGTKMTASQFDLAEARTAADKYTSLQHSQRFAQYFQYLKEHNGPQAIPATYQDFLTLMDQKQSGCISELGSAGINVYPEIKTELPMFMWIKDESEEAIFSIYNIGPDSRELSQQTKNKQVILLLRDIATKLSQVH
jgi:hypothetical protein